MVVVSLIGFADDRIIQIFGFHFSGLSLEALPSLISSTVLFQFLHGDLLHLMMNGLFIYQAGPEVESRMSRQRFIRFFIGSTLFVAVALALFSSGVTIGMSGFCMALLSYLWIDLYTTRHPLANQILFWLIINILIWFMGNISFVGHFFGAIWWLIWWKFFKTWKR
jgi:membrane associated rhomboid family serine protease